MHDAEKCPECDGTGRSPLEPGPESAPPCYICDGTGVSEKRCATCGSSGYVLDYKVGDPLSGGDSKPCPDCA